MNPPEVKSSKHDLSTLDCSLIAKYKALKYKLNPKILTDSRRIQQVLISLQSNAIKFSGKGSETVIYYTLYKHYGESYFEVQVHDEGSGIL